MAKKCVCVLGGGGTDVSIKSLVYTYLRLYRRRAEVFEDLDWEKVMKI